VSEREEAMAREDALVVEGHADRCASHQAWQGVACWCHKHRCLGCAFFISIEFYGEHRAAGLCVRRSPDRQGWPDVGGGDWCGEYAPRGGWRADSD
jgi:hypothetical protein